MTLTKSLIVEHLYQNFKVSKKEAKDIVEIFFKELIQTLAKGEEIKLSGFGNFSILKKRQRIGRNPKTKQEAIISARTVVSFKAGQKLREKIIANTDTIKEKY